MTHKQKIKTKKDEIAEFCQLMIKLNKQNNGEKPICLILEESGLFGFDDDRLLYTNEELINCLDGILTSKMSVL